MSILLLAFAAHVSVRVWVIDVKTTAVGLQMFMCGIVGLFSSFVQGHRESLRMGSNSTCK
jgi:hypothetical protein